MAVVLPIPVGIPQQGGASITPTAWQNVTLLTPWLHAPDPLRWCEYGELIILSGVVYNGTDADNLFDQSALAPSSKVFAPVMLGTSTSRRIEISTAGVATFKGAVAASDYMHINIVYRKS